MVFLTRFLVPEDFGLVAIAYFGVALSKIFIESGLGSALIQKEDATHEDFSTIFIYNFGVSILLYLILFSIAPFVSDFFELDDLTLLIRVLSIVLLINAVSITQRTFLQKKLAFDKLLKFSISSMFVASIVSISIAYYYRSHFAIVANYLVFALIFSIFLVTHVKFRPSITFNKSSFQSMYKYGTRLLASNVISTVYNEGVLLIIGKLYPIGIAGLFSQGRKLADYQMSIYRAFFDGAGFPIFSKNKNNLEDIFLQVTKRIYVVSFPIIAFSIIFAEEIILILFGENWIEAALVLQILGFGIFFLIVESGAKNILKTVNKTDVLLNVEFYKKIFGFSIVLVFAFWSWEALIIALVFVNIISGIVGVITNKIYSDISYKHQIFTFFRYILFLVPPIIISIFTRSLLIEYNIYMICGLSALAFFISYAILLFFSGELKSMLDFE